MKYLQVTKYAVVVLVILTMNFPQSEAAPCTIRQTPQKKKAETGEQKETMGNKHSSIVPPEFRSGLGAIELPNEEGGWVVLILSRGGFTGSGKGDISVTSKGEVICTSDHQKCRNKLAQTELDLISELAAKTDASVWGIPKLGLCSDCYRTMVVLKRRESNGYERVFLSFWDDTTQKMVHDKEFTFYETLLKILSQ